MSRFSVRFISLFIISALFIHTASPSAPPTEHVDLAKPPDSETCGSYNQRTGEVETCKDGGSRPETLGAGDGEMGRDGTEMLAAGSGDGTPLELGSSAQLDKIGPMVVQMDGTLKLIENWEGMTERERLVTWKRVTERNRQRLAAIQRLNGESGEEGEKEGVKI